MCPELVFTRCEEVPFMPTSSHKVAAAATVA